MNDHLRLQAAVNSQRNDPMASFHGGQLEVVGLIDVVGAGEATIDVSFPVKFVEHPSFSFGGEMVENQSITPGSYPTISLMVMRWETVQATPGSAEQDDQLFIGANLIVVTTGSAGHRARAHFSFRGRGLINPVAPNDTPGAS